ncbi:hypothetical protein L202_04157 [Cryptococcus amylolentus CBS 6039]|uniref:Protein YOP1 n=2 Tax=Cryptococcus amylolentus TaxID=104669 RepID=A0A1E3HQB3_9TREE|nr:hypothetical protein L202_04157 [Cryptococcus amylolentus CBS 6039]ODN78538.1 hypothetical protein L202_04157 [Cryptococcus amylolentus CBS 6039]ODO06897.1 hypothetical protein I350_04257 [Cryptococcus amylolentus CBS 6273]
MIFGLLCRWSCNVCSYLYPAYASYKALSQHPESSPEAMAQVERWLMYWAVVGTWTAVEAVIGWTFTWLPLYSFFKTLIFLALSLPQSEASSYVYRAHLAPLFNDHERDIDHFLASLRGRAGGALIEALTWAWNKAKVQLNLSTPEEQMQAAAMLAQMQGQGRPAGDNAYPVQGGQQPPTLNDPASGALQSVFRFASKYAGNYLPVAVTALNAARSQPTQPGQSTQGAVHSRSMSSSSGASQVPESMTMPTPVPTGAVHREQSDPSLRSRTMAYAAGSGSSRNGSNPNLNDVHQQYGALSSARAPPKGFAVPNTNSRSVSTPSRPSTNSSSDSLGSKYEGYEQIGKDEVRGMEDPNRPGLEGRKSSWFGWNGGQPGAGSPSNRKSG